MSNAHPENSATYPLQSTQVSICGLSSLAALQPGLVALTSASVASLNRLVPRL